MTLLPRKLNGLVTCDELSRYSLLPVHVKILGELLPAMHYRRNPPYFCDYSLASKTARVELEAQLKQNVSPGHPIRLLEFSNCRIFGQGSVVLSDQRIIKDSVQEFTNHGLAPDGSSKLDDRFILPRIEHPRLFGGVSVLVKRPWWRNFGHWIVDLMPLLPLIRSYAASVDHIIFGDVEEGALKTMMQTAAANIFPSATCVWMRDDEQLEVERLLYVEPVHIPPLFKHPQAIDVTVEFARYIHGRWEQQEPHRRIYLSRQRSGARRIDNASEIESLLAEAGFETIFPEDLTFSEQIAVFETAKIIVGVKGAAMTNAIFSSPGTHVVVLSPPNFIDPFYWDLLSPREIKYSEIYCAAAGEATSIGQQDLHVDTAVLTTCLRVLDNKQTDVCSASHLGKSWLRPRRKRG